MLENPRALAKHRRGRRQGGRLDMRRTALDWPTPTRSRPGASCWRRSRGFIGRSGACLGRPRHAIGDVSSLKALDGVHEGNDIRASLAYIRDRVGVPRDMSPSRRVGTGRTSACHEFAAALHPSRRWRGGVKYRVKGNLLAIAEYDGRIARSRHQTGLVENPSGALSGLCAPRSLRRVTKAPVIANRLMATPSRRALRLRPSPSEV